ncbi:MAG: hypothetical protein ABEJ79_09130 [Halolamina sp.]
MAFKAAGETQMEPINRSDSGVGWLAHPEEGMQRASHAVVGDDGGVWVFDPVDADGVDDLLADYGEVAGVVVGLDRHERDAERVARRHDVAVHVPSWMTGVAEEATVPVERFDEGPGESGIRAVEVRDSSLPPWQEAAYLHEASDTLYVPEAVGTADFFRTDGERVGVHPMLRISPPREALSGHRPDRLLVGHGTGVESDAANALKVALDGARSGTLSLYLKNASMLLP